jgi:hypothetical protein
VLTLFRGMTVALTLSMLGTIPAAEPKKIADLELTLAWEKNFLTIRGGFPGETMRVHYIEAYCRAGSTDRDWKETVIRHQSELIKASPDGKSIELRCTLADGVVVEHRITTKAGEVDFRILARNPSARDSEVHWAQPCIRVDRFTGATQADYFRKAFIYLDGQRQPMPTADWATTARYTPGQVWAAKGVDRGDVNPRPLNPRVPSNGLIGCTSGSAG